jgi:hypothetical protein
MISKVQRSMMALRSANRTFFPLAQRGYLADLGLDSNSLMTMDEDNKKAG